MNVIKIYGGIGNQLFQYAFGRAMKTDVAYNVGFYDEVKERQRKWPRPYRLDKFKINVPLSPILRQHVVREINADFSINMLKRRDCNFDGYWQFLHFYHDVREELKKEYHIKENYYTEDFLKYKDIIVNEQAIGVHVRRGDYLVQTWGILPTRYYFEAIRLMPEGPLVIFSDDIPWCQETLKEDYFDRKIYFVGLEDYLDFGLFRFCKHVIMASSTFSWWNAFLCEGTVVCPVPWLGGRIAPDLIYPKEWIKINVC